MRWSKSLVRMLINKHKHSYVHTHLLATHLITAGECSICCIEIIEEIHFIKLFFCLPLLQILDSRCCLSLSTMAHTMAPRLALIQIMLKVKVEGHDIGYQRSAISAIAALPVVLYLLKLSSLKFLIISSETFRCRRKAVSLSSSSILSTQ